jgi:hypothetical protein
MSTRPSLHKGPLCRGLRGAFERKGSRVRAGNAGASRRHENPHGEMSAGCQKRTCAAGSCERNAPQKRSTQLCEGFRSLERMNNLWEDGNPRAMQDWRNFSLLLQENSGTKKVSCCTNVLNFFFGGGAARGRGWEGTRGPNKNRGTPAAFTPEKHLIYTCIGRSHPGGWEGTRGTNETLEQKHRAR